MKKIMCLLLALSLTSCSLFVPSHENLSVLSDQIDSEIYINGALIGKGAVVASVKRNKNTHILVKKDGFHTVQRNIDSHLNVFGVMDIIGGILFLIPIIGLMAPGAYSISESNISIMMVEK